MRRTAAVALGYITESLSAKSFESLIASEDDLREIAKAGGFLPDALLGGPFGFVRSDDGMYRPGPKLLQQIEQSFAAHFSGPATVRHLGPDDLKFMESDLIELGVPDASITAPDGFFVIKSGDEEVKVEVPTIDEMLALKIKPDWMSWPFWVLNSRSPFYDAKLAKNVLQHIAFTNLAWLARDAKFKAFKAKLRRRG